MNKASLCGDDEHCADTIVPLFYRIPRVDLLEFIITNLRIVDGRGTLALYPP